MLKCIYACKYEKKAQVGEQHDFLSFLGHPNPEVSEREGFSTHVCVQYFDNSVDICSSGDHPNWPYSCIITTSDKVNFQNKRFLNQYCSLYC